MQEVWFKKDYEFLKNCTAPKYWITKFDEECGRLNPVTIILATITIFISHVAGGLY